MKLYYSPLACSLVARVALTETGVDAEMVRVSLRTKLTSDGTDYHAINPKGQIPALRLDDGTLLTEGPAVVQFIADRAPDSGFAPRPGTRERYALAEWLNFISTEIHKATLWPIIHPHAGPDAKAFARGVGERRFAYLDATLEDREFLVGDTFGAADAYLAWALSIARITRYDLACWPHLDAYAARQAERPSIKAAMAIEFPEAAEDFPQLAL